MATAKMIFGQIKILAGHGWDNDAECMGENDEAKAVQLTSRANAPFKLAA